MYKKNFRMKALSMVLAVLFCVSLLMPSQVLAEANTQPSSALNESDIIYMVLTDRFYDGDSTNNGTLNQEYRPGQLKYTQGGDWKGLTQKLDYIKNLGVTAIWISPPSQNELLSRDGEESGYHGYFTHDYNSADPHYGTKQDLIDLVNSAHAKGLKVILDVVPNHTADYFAGTATTYSSADYQPAAPFNNPSSVSYTHLDVYKRQPLGRLERRRRPVWRFPVILEL